MPFLLRIILQRTLLFSYSILTFLGISPEINIPTQQSIQIQQARKEAVAEIIERQNLRNIQNTSDKPTDNIERVIPDPVISKPQEVTEPVVTPAPTIAPATETPIQIPPIVKPTPPTAEIIPTENTASASIRDVVVNIICTYTNGNYINVSTGSGVIISPRGVVLTNSHVAQFFILESYDPDLINCSIYKENISTYGYKGEMVYSSPEWIQNNYKSIGAEGARGTGEDDYALILITKNTNPALGIPQIFPSAGIYDKEIKINDSVVVSGFPGGPASLLDISHAGKLQAAAVSVLEIFTFGGNKTDVITTSKSNVGAQGASGGGIFYGESENSLDLVGIIATTDGSNGKAKINGITTSYISRDIEKETGKSLNYFIKGDIASRVVEFKNEYIERLAKLLLKEI